MINYFSLIEESYDKRIEFFLTRPAVICGLAMVCCILWGSAFPCVKIGYEMFHIADGDVGSQILFGECVFSIRDHYCLDWLGLEKKFPWPKKNPGGL